MAWIFLILGGFFEVGFTSCLSKVRGSSGTELVMWLIGFVISCTLSMYFLYKGSQSIPMGTAYAVWAGIGAVGTVLIGIFVMKDPVTFLRLLFITTLIGSIIGLKVVSH